MKPRYRLFRRKSGVFYIFDRQSNKRESLETKNSSDAQRLLHARNEAQHQPLINRHIARAYLAASDSEIAHRTWQDVIHSIISTKRGPNQDRWKRAERDQAFDPIRQVKVFSTQAEHFLKVLEHGSVSTNVFLRRIHNFAVDVGWLPWPVLPKKQWPTVRYAAKRAITFTEHLSIISREKNEERRAFYQLCWHLGGSQGDVARLMAEDVDWTNHVVSYRRQKTQNVAQLHFGEEVASILKKLPNSGMLFPYLASVRASDRATEFKQRCDSLGIKGVTLHSYRYAWAERAKTCGYPERFAQEALGHNSQAVHRAYAKNARVILPSLETFEKRALDQKIIPFQTEPTPERDSQKQQS